MVSPLEYAESLKGPPYINDEDRLAILESERKHRKNHLHIDDEDEPKHNDHGVLPHSSAKRIKRDYNTHISEIMDEVLQDHND